MPVHVRTLHQRLEHARLQPGHDPGQHPPVCRAQTGSGRGMYLTPGAVPLAHSQTLLRLLASLVNTNDLYNICTMYDVVQMLYKCFVFAGCTPIIAALCCLVYRLCISEGMSIVYITITSHDQT